MKAATEVDAGVLTSLMQEPPRMYRNVIQQLQD